MKSQCQRDAVRRGGFTLVELLIASLLSALVTGGALAVYIGILRAWREIDCRLGASREANLALSRMIYGVDRHPGLREATSYSVATGADGWTLTYTTLGVPFEVTNRFVYSESASNLTYNPGGIPVAEDVSAAVAVAQGRGVTVSVRVDRVEGEFEGQCEIGTQVVCRN